MRLFDAAMLVGAGVMLAYTAGLYLDVVLDTGESRHVAPPPESFQRTPDMSEVRVTDDTYAREVDIAEARHDAHHWSRGVDEPAHDHDPDITAEHLSGEWTLGDAEDDAEEAN